MMSARKEVAMSDSDRVCRATPDAPEIRVWPFAFGFVGLLCAMAIEFVSASRLPVPNSVDYGYDERLEAGSKTELSCSDKGAAIVRSAMDNLDDLRASATVARSGPQSTAKLQTEAIGDHHVE
jgi:hypothetical protein